MIAAAKKIIPSRRENLPAFARITGPLLALAFGSTFLFLTLHRLQNSWIGESLEKEGENTFVVLDQAQSKKGVFGRRYFYSYTGRYREQIFQKTEEVPDGMFHLHSEGKNLQAVVYIDPAGTIHSRLKANPLEFGKPMGALASTSLVLSLAGCLLTGFAVVLLLLRKEDSPQRSERR